MKNVKTAVLMPTHNRRDALQDTLTACLGLYNKFNFDVYVFDSNDDNQSEKVIKELQVTHLNLYYIRCCSLMDADSKFWEAIRGFHLKKDYDYVYVCGDANSLTKLALERIYPYLQENVDLVQVREEPIAQTSEWNDANSYFNSEQPDVCAWYAIICNKRTLLNLNDNDWNNMIAKWGNSQYKLFMHIGFWLDRLAQCKTLRIVEPFIGGKNPTDRLRRSKYKKESCWKLDMLETVVIVFPKVIDALPSIYTHKREYIRKFWIPWGGWVFDRSEYFYQLKQYKGFKLKDYIKYKKALKKYDVNAMGYKILIIALLPRFLVAIIAKKPIHIYTTKKDYRLNFFGAKFTIFPKFNKTKQ